MSAAATASAGTVLTVNAGSSSIRFDLVDIAGAGQTIASLHEPRDGGPDAARVARFAGRDAAHAPLAVAHRLVLGGAPWRRTRRIDDDLERELERWTPRSPLHLPRALGWIRAAREALPEVPHLLLSDSTFFANLPEVASSYALPREPAAALGIARFGFHGFAHAAIWRRWSATVAPRGRVVTLQLGSGCSAAALRDGRPLDTTMGFSPVEGLVMATRSGDVDPLAVVRLQREAELSADAVERILDQESGLLGVSGRSGDMRRLAELVDDPAARFAIELFAYRVRKTIGAYAAVLGGLDGILFGGGIGEHAPAVRAACLAGLDFLGIELDGAANDAARGGDAAIAAAGSSVALRVVAVDEAGEMARAAREWIDCESEANDD